jgi:hypothetical protein
MENQSQDLNPEIEPQIDQNKLNEYLEDLRIEQNFPLAILVGALAALVGAALWGLITSLSGYQIGYMALGVGFLVGMAVRLAGKGIDPQFGYLGAGLALLGCLIGNYLGIVFYFAKEANTSFFEAYRMINALSSVSSVMAQSFDVMDILFYGIAIYEGYKFSFRRISEEEIWAKAGLP